MQSKVDATFRLYDMRLKSNTFYFPKRGLHPAAVPLARRREWAAVFNIFHGCLSKD